MAVELAGSTLFVIGCVAFYIPSLYVLGVTLFLAGSMLMLVSAAARTFARYGPSR